MATPVSAATSIVDSVVGNPDLYTFAGLTPAVSGPQDVKVCAAHLAASLAAKTNDRQTLAWGLHVIDLHLDRWQRVDGGIYSGNPEISDEIATSESMAAIGKAIAAVTHMIGSQRLIHYRAAMTRLADFLRAWGKVPYYVNGNIELVKAEAFWHAYLVTGEQRFRGDYERQMNFARTAGVGKPAPGWVQDTQTTGHFAEYGSGAGGLDWNYTMYQNAILTNLWYATKDPRVWVWLNHTCAKLLERIDKVRNNDGWVLDVSGGSRVGVGQSPGPAWWYYLATAGFVAIGDAEAAESVGTVLTALATESVSTAQVPGYWRAWSRVIAQLIDIGWGEA